MNFYVGFTKAYSKEAQNGYALGTYTTQREEYFKYIYRIIPIEVKLLYRLGGPMYRFIHNEKAPQVCFRCSHALE